MKGRLYTTAASVSVESDVVPINQGVSASNIVFKPLDGHAAFVPLVRDRK